LWAQSLYMKNFTYLFLLLCTLTANAQNTIYPYSDGQHWGLTNTNREVIAAPQFDVPVFFEHNQPYAIAVKNKKFGLIDRTGGIQLPFTYKFIELLPGGFAAGAVMKKYRLLNLNTGTEISKDLYDLPTEYCFCDEKLFIVYNYRQYFIISGITGQQIGKIKCAFQ
jgi:hypothetical protein